ncbi:MAG: AMIN domain-containing protein [Vicinamibacterales bacterium]
MNAPRICGWLLTLGVVAGGAATAEAAGRARQSGSPQLQAVTVTPNGQFVHVTLRGSGPLPLVSPARTTEGPPRLFVDLPGVLAGGVPPQIGGAGPVVRVRVAQYSIDPLVTRVVLDLQGDVSFGVSQADGPFHDVTIAVASRAATAAAAPAPDARPAPARVDPPPTPLTPAGAAGRTIVITPATPSPAAAVAAARATSPAAAPPQAPPSRSPRAAVVLQPQPEPTPRPVPVTPGLPRLTGVSVTPNGAFVQVQVSASSALPPVTPVRADDQNPRLIVDLPGVEAGALPARLDGAGPVVAVRVAPHPTDDGITRVSFDLAGDVTFGVARSNDTSSDITIAVAAVTATPARDADAPAAPASILAASGPGSPVNRPMPPTPAPKAAAPAAGPGPTRLTGLTLTPDGAFVQVELRASGALPRIAPVSTHDGRPRLVVDLPGVQPGAVPARLPGAGPIVGVRLTPHPSDPLATRVSFDLAGEVAFGVVRAGDASTDVTIAVAPSTADAPAAAAEPLPAPDPPPTKHPDPSAAAVPSMSPDTAAPTPATAASAPGTPASAAVAVASTETIPMAAAMSPTAAQGAPVTVAMSTAPAAAADGQAPATSPMSTAQVPMPAPRPTSGFGMGRQAPRPTGRVSVYTSGASASQMGGETTSYGDITTAVTYQFLDRDTDGVEFGLDMRHSAYTIEGRDPRVSVYNGFVGARLANGHATVRAGQLWLDDLGGLGAVAGGQVEARSGPIPSSGLGRWRGGLFAGLDPNIYKFGYGEGVRKTGGYAILEGTRGRRHVAGYVNIRNGDITERSVLSFANFVPAGPLFVYQVAEYDLSPIAGGLGHDGLTYFFTNARLMAGPRAEVQGTVSRGRSVDARGLSDDIQAGRPVTQQAVDGLLYESVGGRVTAEVLPRVRVYGGYSRDKNNRDDAPTNRWLTGGYASNVFDSGVDVTVSDSRMMRPGGSYHSTFVSAGREFGGRLYATAEFSTALSQIQFVRGDGLVVESRPSTKRFGMNATMQVGRQVSSFLSVERTMDGPDYREWRVLAGLTYRLR